MKTENLLIIMSAAFLCACGSAPIKSNAPSWAHDPARVVDNGYIVYVAKGDDRNPDRAQFKAEGLALEDLANECSIIPKGTRIEDRYVEEMGHNSYEAYVKIGLEFQVCDSAKKTIQPEEIKNLASLPFSEQLRKYQDLIETGEMPRETDVAETVPPVDYAPPPAAQTGYDEGTHFFMTRQYVAYQKEIVVLSPPTAYAPGTPDHQRFISAVSPSVQQIQTAEEQDPTLVNRPTTWSTLRNRPSISRPRALLTPRNRAIEPVRMKSTPQRVLPADKTKAGHAPGAHRRGGGGRRRKKKSVDRDA